MVVHEVFYSIVYKSNFEQSKLPFGLYIIFKSTNTVLLWILIFCLQVFFVEMSVSIGHTCRWPVHFITTHSLRESSHCILI